MFSRILPLEKPFSRCFYVLRPARDPGLSLEEDPAAADSPWTRETGAGEAAFLHQHQEWEHGNGFSLLVDILISFQFYQASLFCKKRRASDAGRLTISRTLLFLRLFRAPEKFFAGFPGPADGRRRGPLTAPFDTLKVLWIQMQRVFLFLMGINKMSNQVKRQRNICTKHNESCL